MSENAYSNPLLLLKKPVFAEFEINITDEFDLGTVGIHQSRFDIPAQSVFIPFAGGYVKDNPLVGTGASIAIGTDNVTTDPDNILDTQAITALDAENDCLTPAFGTAIVNNTDSALPIYYNITNAALTAGIHRGCGLLFTL